MRFLLDENAGPSLAEWLRGEGHEVFSIYEEDRGASDDAILRRARKGGWILVTADKDFGEKVYRERQRHKGVILIRLRSQRSQNRLQALARLLENYADRLEDNFVVVTESSVRINEAPPN